MYSRTVLILLSVSALFVAGCGTAPPADEGGNTTTSQQELTQETTVAESEASLEDAAQSITNTS